MKDAREKETKAVGVRSFPNEHKAASRYKVTERRVSIRDVYSGFEETKTQKREAKNTRRTKNVSENVHTWASTARDRAESFRVPANSLPKLYERCVRGLGVQFRDIERVSRARLVAGKYQNTQTQTRGRGERKIAQRDSGGRGVVEKLRGVFEGVRMRRDALEVRGE